VLKVMPTVIWVSRAAPEADVLQRKSIANGSVTWYSTPK
jgi:hypothetical protein